MQDLAWWWDTKECGKDISSGSKMDKQGHESLSKILKSITKMLNTKPRMCRNSEVGF